MMILCTWPRNMVADALREYRRDYKNGDMSRYEFEQVKAQLIKRATPK